MRRLLLVAALALIVIAAAAPIGATAGGERSASISTVAASAPAAPTAAQIRAAVNAASRSTHLWATVNVCDTRQHPNMLGIRAQMPALGFPAHLSILIQVDYWSSAHKRFVVDPSPHASRLSRLGVVSFGYEQGGHSFSFTPGRFRATVTFEWRRSGKLLLSVTRRTSAGHSDADHADPAGFSAGFCTIR